MSRQEVVIVLVEKSLYLLCEEQDGYDVRNYHEGVEHVRHVPYELYLSERSKEYADRYYESVRLNSFRAEQILDVSLSEEVPSYDRGECEEQQADGDKHGAEAAEHGAERGLGQIVYPVGIAFDVRMTRAVMSSTMNVSMNTPAMATNPCWQG